MGAGSGAAGLIGRPTNFSGGGEMRPQYGYLRLVEKGNRPVMGECTEANHVGWTKIPAFDYDIPPAAEKNHPRKSSGFSISKEVDRITPLLFTHLTSNEPFESATVEVMYKDRPGEPPKLWARLQFTTAVVVSIKSTKANVPDATAQENAPLIQDVTFTYEKVESKFEKVETTWGDRGS